MYPEGTVVTSVEQPSPLGTPKTEDPAKPPIAAEKPVEPETPIVFNPEIEDDEQLRIRRLKLLRKEKRMVKTALPPEKLVEKAHENGRLVALINDEKQRLEDYTKAAKGRMAENTAKLFENVKSMDEGTEQELLCEVRFDEPGNHLYYILPDEGRIVASQLSFKGDRNRWESDGVAGKDKKASKAAKTPSDAVSETQAPASGDSGGLVPVLDGAPVTDPAPTFEEAAAIAERYHDPNHSHDRDADPFVDPEAVALPTSRTARHKPDEARVDRWSSPEFWLLHESGKLDPTREDEEAALSELEGAGSEPAVLTTAIGKAHEELDALEGDLCEGLRRSARARTAVNAGLAETHVADVDSNILSVRANRAVVDVASALLKIAEDAAAALTESDAGAAEATTA